jgi:hypothetical protein
MMPVDRQLTALAPETPEDLSDLEELRTLVTLCRTHRRDIGERQIFVRIDDGPRVALRFGQSFTLEIKPGRHQLRAHNTLFWRTVIFHVEAGEHLEFLLINKGGPITFGIAALLGSAPVFLKIERRSVV